MIDDCRTIDFDFKALMNEIINKEYKRKYLENIEETIQSQVLSIEKQFVSFFEQFGKVINVEFDYNFKDKENLFLSSEIEIELQYEKFLSSKEFLNTIKEKQILNVKYFSFPEPVGRNIIISFNGEDNQSYYFKGSIGQVNLTVKESILKFLNLNMYQNVYNNIIENSPTFDKEMRIKTIESLITESHTLNEITSLIDKCIIKSEKKEEELGIASTVLFLLMVEFDNLMEDNQE